MPPAVALLNLYILYMKLTSCTENGSNLYFLLLLLYLKRHCHEIFDSMNPPCRTHICIRRWRRQHWLPVITLIDDTERGPAYRLCHCHRRAILLPVTPETGDIEPRSDLRLIVYIFANCFYFIWMMKIGHCKHWGSWKENLNLNRIL